MKTEKQTLWTGVLVIAVCVVWAVIIYKFVSFTGKGFRLAETSVPTNKHSLPEKRKLKLDYRDPFLKEKPTQDTKGKQQADFLPVPEKAPGFIYKGKIRKGQEEYLILQERGELRLVRKGELVDGFRIGASGGDSVVVFQASSTYVLYAE